MAFISEASNTLPSTQFICEDSSLSSNVVYTQRVRTLDDALESSQINCVDGSVLLASLMKAININPILVRIPGHMFVGYYTDKSHKNMNFLETTMIGDVNLDDFFPDEKCFVLWPLYHNGIFMLFFTFLTSDGLFTRVIKLQYPFLYFGDSRSVVHSKLMLMCKN